MRAKRIISSVLSIVLMFSQCINVFAETLAQEKENDKKLEMQLRGSDEFAALYPNGKFDFLAATMNASENLDSVEIAVVRKGGTKGEAEIDLKAIDVSAKYGEDYVIKVGDSFFKTELSENPEAKPLIEAYYDVSKIKEETEKEDDIIEVIDSQTSDTSVTVNSVLGANPFEGLEEEQEELTETNHRKGSLKNARNAFTGEISERKDWNETDKKDTSNEDALFIANESIQNWADEIPGVSTTLKFADGEYMKTITVDIIDDNISESDEQILFVISEPTNGVLGDVYKAYLNIEDNDKKEIQKYEMSQDEISVRRTDGTAEIKIIRTAGIEKFGSVYVQTAEITAKHDIDYETYSEEVVFPQGVTERTVSIPILKEESNQDGLQFKVTLDKSSEIVNSSKAETIVTLNNDNKEFAAKTRELSLLSEGEEYEEIVGFKHDENGYYKEILFDEKNSDKISRDNGNSDKNLYKSNTIYVSEYNKEQTWTIDNIDLTMVKQVCVEWENSTNGTYWETKKCKKVTNKGYYTDGDNWVTFGSDGAKFRPNSYSNIKFGRQTTSMNVPENSSAKNQKSNIKFHTKTLGSNKYSNLRIHSVRLYYAPFSVTVASNTYSQTDNNTAKNALVDIKEWTISRNNSSGYSFDSVNNTSYTITRKAVNAGSLKFSNTSNTKQDFYYGKTISFTPQYNLDKNRVYLAGILISNGSKDILLEGKTSITLDNSFFSTYRDYITKPYSSNPSFTVYPVYYPKPCFIYFPQTSNGYMVSHNQKDKTDIMKVSRLDTVKLQAVANSGKFVSGFKVYGTDSTGITTDKTSTNTNVKEFRKSANRNYKITTNNVMWNQNDPSYITIAPSVMSMKIEPYYDNPYVTVKANPKNSNKDKGAIYYIDGDKSVNGDYNNPIVINPMVMGKVYSFNSVSEDGYSTKWQDFTGDKNFDGKFDKTEAKELENYKVDRSAVVGSTYNYVPGKFAAPLIYYGFYPTYTSGDKGTIEGILRLVQKPVFSTKETKVPIKGAKITISDMTTTTDSSGSYTIESNTLADADKAMVTANFDGNFYTFSQDVNVAKIVNIDEYNTFSVTSAKLFKDGAEIKKEELETFDATAKIEIGTKSDSSILVCSKALFKTYDKNGSLLFSDTVTSPDGNGFFSYEFNPATKGITPGSTMTVQFFDQNDKGYMVHDMGVTFKRYISTSSVFTSFKSPVKPVFELLGSIKPDFDFGISINGGNVESKRSFTRETKTENGQVMNYKTLSLGFKASYNDDSNTADEESKLAKLTEYVKNDINGSGKLKDETKKQVKEATDTSDNGNKQEAEVSAQVSLSLAVGVDIVMEESQVETGEYFFKDLIFTVTCAGGFGMETELPTPICVNIIIGFEVSGEVTGTIVISRGKNAKESYFNENGEINLGNLTMLTEDEAKSESSDFTFYGALQVVPSIKLKAGVSIAKILNVTVDGTVSFDLNFNTLGKSSGAITMNAGISLTVLMFTKRWDMGTVTEPIFGKSRSSDLVNLKSGGDFLHDSISDMEKTNISYMKNRSGWNSGVSRLRNSDSVVENTLIKGANPYPQSVIKQLPDGRFMLVFIDDDISKDEYNYATVKYSVYSSGGWSEPAAIDNDKTADEAPDLFVLDNGMVMAVWSSADEKITKDDNAIEALNKMNIKSAIYNGSSFGEPVEVTHTTAADYCADTQPKLASGTIDGKEIIILYYTKTEYEATEEDGVIGDLVNPYSVTAYMFYDVENDEWVNTYSQKDKDEIINTGIAHTSSGELVTEDNFNVYESEWYGQGFVSLGSNVVINDFDKTNENGFWTEMPEIKEGDNDVDPMVVDSSVISYENLSIFAYTVDFDQDPETTYDREIYVQVYDFNTNEFFYPIQITSNDVSDSAVKLGRFGDSTYIIWLSEGKIKYFNFSNAYKNCLLEKEINGKKVYIIDKSSEENFIPEGIVIDAGENVKISEFEAAADSENNVYVLWTQTGLTYKDGIDQTSEEAVKPENQYSENQIYMARYSADRNSFGKWSAPVQITDEQGANYSNAAFAVADNGVIAVVTKGMSKVDSKYGAKEDISSRILAFLNFKAVDKVSIADLTFAEYYADDMVLVEAAVKNKGFEDHNDIYVEFYSNGVKSENIAIDSLDSGSETVISAVIPVGIAEVKLYTSKGEIDTISSETVSKPDIVIDAIYAEIAERNIINFTAEITNKGTANAENTLLKVISDTTKETVGECKIESLNMGESLIVDFYAEIDDRVYEKISTEDDSYFLEETASFTIAPEYGDSTKTSVIRYLTKEEKNLIDSVSPIINDGVSSINVVLNDYELVYDNVTEENAKLKVVWESSNEDIAEVNANGLVSGISKGTAVITAKIMPSDRTIFVLSDGLSELEDIYSVIPEEGIITKTIEVNVIDASEITTNIEMSTENTTTEETSKETETSDRNTSSRGHGGGSPSRKAAVLKTEITNNDEKKNDENMNTNDTDTNKKDKNNIEYKVFDDVKGTWAEKAIMYLAEKGIVSGIGNNMFAPEKNVTRAEFITMLMRMLNADADISSETAFSDVPADAYYYEYVLKAKVLGIALGYNDNTFKPNENISRQDMFVFTERALSSLGKIKADDLYLLSYSDIDLISEYAKESIRILSSIGIVNGSENLVKPLDNAKRNESAQMIYNIVLLLETE